MMQARLTIRTWDGRHDRRIGHAQVRDGADPAVLVDRCHQIARRAHPGRAAGPGNVAAADRGRRGVAAAAPALRLPGHRRDPGLLGPGKHRRRGGPVVRSCGPGLQAGLPGRVQPERRDLGGAHPPTSACFRSRAPGPVSGELYGQHPPGGPVTLPISRCLSAAGIGFLGVLFPPGTGLPLRSADRQRAGGATGP